MSTSLDSWARDAMTLEASTKRVPLTLLHALAIAAALRVTDDEYLLEEGVRTAVLDHLQGAFEALDDKLTAVLGEDWLFLTNTAESLQSESDFGAEV